MIVTELHNGQGLGNQLWCYITTRVIAKDKGYDFGIQSPEKFRGNDFLKLDFGKPVIGGTGPEGGPPLTLPNGIQHYYVEKTAIHPLNGSEIRLFDEKLVNIEDNTKIEGFMQDEQYIIHRKEEIREWLKVEEEHEFYDFADDNICVIKFRGTGYVSEKDFYLTETFWENAVNNMRKINPHFKFIVITDDVKNAKKFFPNFDVFNFSIAKDYIIIKNAHYLILANSSFSWFPAWLNENLKFCIAPKYWARHNISDGYWSLGYNITTGWMYQDRNGNLQDYASCLKELNIYVENNKELFLNESPFTPSIIKSIKNTIHIFNTFSKETTRMRALESTAKLVTAKTIVIIKRKIWRTLFNLKKSPAIKQAKTSVRKIIDFQERIFRQTKWNIAEYRAKKKWLMPEVIARYRKTIKVYDVFTFFDELDLLEIRLNILDEYVDYFVIIEATETFSGIPRSLCYEQNKQRFEKWKHKIIYHIVDDVPTDEDDLREKLSNDKNLSDLDREMMSNAITGDTLGKDGNGKVITTWLKEYYVKESIKKALVGLRDEDICYISDLDAIWNPELVIDYSKDDVFKLRQIGYMYYLNNRSNQEDWHGWAGTIVTKYKNIRNTCLSHLRSHRKMKSKYIFLRNGGWHFSFLGGYEGAKKKLEQYAHFWYEPKKNLPDLEKRVANNQDYRGKNVKLQKDERGLPKFLLNSKEKYKNFFR